MPSQNSIAIVTEDRFEGDNEGDWYKENIELEETLLADALQSYGYTCARVSWSRPSHDFGQYSAAILRSTWDYFDRIHEFLPWLRDTSQKTLVLNPLKILEWNKDKRYLLDLASKGASIVPTTLVKKTEAPQRAADLQTWMRAAGTELMIFKPTVSGGARHTHLVNHDNIEAKQRIFDELVTHEDFLMQPFVPEIQQEGEISMMVFAGVFSHAVRKVPAKGDFRVQDDLGGSVLPFAATAADMAFAESVVKLVGEVPYARVDAVRTALDKDEPSWSLMELELLEPELWLRKDENAAARFAKGDTPESRQVCAAP